MRVIVISALVLALGAVAVGWFAYPRPAVDPPPSDVVPPAARAGACRIALPVSDSAATIEAPALAVDSEDRALLAWAVDTGESERTLFLARSTDGGASFTTPAPFRKIAVRRYTALQKGKEVLRSSHVQPRLAASGATVVLGWTEPAADGHIDFLIARSSDGGVSFAPPVKVHGAAAARPGYTGLAATNDGTQAATWLDSRNGKQQPFCSLARAAGAFAPEMLVFTGPAGRGICPCCNVEILCGTDGATYVAFRNNDKDVRDIFVARAPAGSAAFEPPVTVCTHGWQVAGCPHDGPAMALSGGRLHVAWMDAHTGVARVYWSRSGLDRLEFTACPLAAQDGGTQGHPKLAAGQGTLYAVWESSTAVEPAGHAHGHAQPAAKTGKERTIRCTRWLDGADGPGASWALDAPAGVLQVDPALTVTPSGTAVAAWIEYAADARTIVVCRIAKD